MGLVPAMLLSEFLSSLCLHLDTISLKASTELLSLKWLTLQAGRVMLHGNLWKHKSQRKLSQNMYSRPPPRMVSELVTRINVPDTADGWIFTELHYPNTVLELCSIISRSLLSPHHPKFVIYSIPEILIYEGYVFTILISLLMKHRTPRSDS